MKEIEQLTLGIQRIERLLQRMEKSNALEHIEIDLLLQELRNLYSTALLLPTTPASAAVVETAEESAPAPAVKPEKSPERTSRQTVTPPVVAAIPKLEEIDPEVEAQPLMDELESNDNEILFEEAAPAEATLPEPEIETKPDPVAEITVAEAKAEAAVAQQPDTPKRPQRQSSLFEYIHQADRPTENGSETLGDKLGRTGNEVRGESEQHKKVTDLRTIININDKFSFMKDLFQNNMKAYNDFILQLNSIDDRATAQRRVDEVAQIYGWDKSSLTAKTFFSIFDRKF